MYVYSNLYNNESESKGWWQLGRHFEQFSRKD